MVGNSFRILFYFRNGRLQYARELSKYIGVDIYGSCGNYSCPRTERFELEKITDETKNLFKLLIVFSADNLITLEVFFK